MTPSILIVPGILGVAIVLFVTERLRVDLVAILVMLALARTGILSGEEAIAGFSNEAVITHRLRADLERRPDAHRRRYGGDRFPDYTKVGFPLTFLLPLLVLFFLPLIWPLSG